MSGAGDGVEEPLDPTLDPFGGSEGEPDPDLFPDENALWHARQESRSGAIFEYSPWTKSDPGIVHRNDCILGDGAPLWLAAQYRFYNEGHLMDSLPSQDYLGCAVCLPLPASEDDYRWANFIPRSQRERNRQDLSTVRGGTPLAQDTPLPFELSSKDNVSYLKSFCRHLGQIQGEDIPNLARLVVDELWLVFDSPPVDSVLANGGTAAGLVAACFSAVDRLSESHDTDTGGEILQGPDVNAAWAAVALGARAVAAAELSGVEKIVTNELRWHEAFLEDSGTREELVRQICVFFFAQLACYVDDTSAEDLISELASLVNSQGT